MAIFLASLVRVEMNRVPRRILQLSAPVFVAAVLHAHSPRQKRNVIAGHIALCDAHGQEPGQGQEQGKPKPTNDYIIVHPEFNYEEGGEEEKYSLKFEDGTMYQGETNHDQMHGLGKLKLYDGTIYIGTFVHGKLEGEATILSEQTVYVGETKDWIPHGLGKLTDATGTVCEGCFYRGEINGHATITNINGTVFEGEFENSISKGHGKYTSAEYISEGSFVDFKLTEGSTTFTDGREEQGTFVDGKLHGWGKSVWKDGTIVEGEYVNGEPVGVLTVRRDGAAATLGADSLTFMYYKMRRYVGV